MKKWLRSCRKVVGRVLAGEILLVFHFFLLTEATAGDDKFFEDNLNFISFAVKGRQP